MKWEKENTDEIALRFFSGEFQHREYVIEKIREMRAEVQRCLEETIREKQNALLNDPQTLMRGKAFVYLIREEDFARKQFFFKIGSSNNPGKRLQQFQTGNPHLLHLWAAMPFRNYADAVQKESVLHGVCRQWQERGEWFQGPVLNQLLPRAERFAPYINIPQGPLI